MDHDQLLRDGVDLAVATIRDTPVERYDDPTPCADFTVANLINHLAFGLVLARCSGTREPWDPAWTADSPAPVLDGLPRSEWARAAADAGAQVVAAWADPAAWSGDSHMGGAPMPAAVIGSMMTGEFAVHSWDLAAATGRRVDVGAGLGEVALEAMTGMASMGRDAGWIGPEVTVDADAPAFERALAVSGRDPAWTA
ncbi:TIGR03086 family metal-binding protein [Pseudonocardia sp. KRD291]|uniref:TIGR03086 family metal-binding protein n=1 Tax=Pseudonocardia sp. KRD291 TaxID=2792007 RepID=UPI001C4A2244|nr:TIGR03086 family metal-binding protein [Pseudonocardia sp. KRD291]MBW0105628.1 TIGR03086 family protein [Pseudonocardia sp. KRD291]